MFADNEMISERQLTVQLMLSFLGPLLLVIPGQKEFGGREGIFGILLGFGAFAIYLFFLLRLAGVCRTGKGSRTGDEGGYSVSLRRDSDSVGGFSFSVHGADRGGISGGGRR